MAPLPIWLLSFSVITLRCIGMERLLFPSFRLLRILDYRGAPQVAVTPTVNQLLPLPIRFLSQLNTESAVPRRPQPEQWLTCCLGDHSRALLSAMRVIYRTGSWPKSWDLLLPCRGWLSSMNRQLFLLLHDLLGWASSDDMPVLFGIFLAGYSPAQPPWLVSAPAIPTSSAGPQ